MAPSASDSEVLAMIEARGLFAKGLGYIDVHLIASALLMPGLLIWTRDVRLHRAAGMLGLAADKA